MDRGFRTSFDLGGGQRWNLRDQDWLKRPLALVRLWTSSETFVRSVVRIADKMRLSSEHLALWLCRCLVAWPAVKTFLLLDSDIGDGETVPGDVFSDRGYRNLDAASVASEDSDAFRQQKFHLVEAVPSSRDSSTRQDLVAPSPRVTRRELILVRAASSIVEEYGAPNPVKIKPHCRPDQLAPVLLSSTGPASAHKKASVADGGREDAQQRRRRGGRESNEKDGNSKKRKKAEEKEKNVVDTGRPPSPSSLAAAWRCLFARTVDAAFFKACIEEGFFLVPIDVSEFPLFFELFSDKDKIVLVADDDSDVNLLSELDDGSSFCYPSPCPSNDWGKRGEPSPGRISVGFELFIGEEASRQQSQSLGKRAPVAARVLSRKEKEQEEQEQDRLFEEAVMMDQG